MKKINCILLIDDNPADNVFDKIIISEADVCNHIKIVEDGIEALAYLKKAADPAQSQVFPIPDLIYLDINMPRMTGFQFLDEYRKLDEKLRSKIVIIILTTSLNPDDPQKAATYSEITKFENKPLTVEMVMEDVNKYF